MSALAEPETRTGWAAEWREALGAYWRLELYLIAVLLFVAGFSLPFADPDLPIHLATGEWIAKHHAVPYVEPFAWTRPGAPFLAYSWAIELAYYEVMAHVGPLGLSALQGLVYVGLAGVMLVLGRAAGWNPWVMILMAAANLIVALGATPYLRPQAILLLALPLTWALVYRSLDTKRIWATLAGLFAIAVVLANTHLLFPLMAAPCVLLLGKVPEQKSRILLVPIAILAGWLVSPYTTHLVEMFRLYFAPNPLIGPPSGIAEYKPGFLMLLTAGNSSLAIALLLTVAPWFVASRMDAKNRALYGLLWLGGILMFALAVRSLIVWWVVTIPVASALFCALPTTDATRRQDGAAGDRADDFRGSDGSRAGNLAGPDAASGERVDALPAVHECEIDRVTRAVDRLQHAAVAGEARDDVQLWRLHPVAASIPVRVDRRPDVLSRFRRSSRDLFQSVQGSVSIAAVAHCGRGDLPGVVSDCSGPRHGRGLAPRGDDQ